MVFSIFILPLIFIWCVPLSYISDKFTTSPQSKSLSFIIQFGSSLVLILILFLSINQDPQDFGDVIFNGLTMGIVVTTILCWILDQFVID
ncbi:hypothetical protein RZN22_15495 [Bacillaceae bacterium S4-13-58]